MTKTPQPNLTDRLSKIVADEDYYRDYFRAQIPNDQQQPSTKNLAWLKSIAAADLNYQALSDGEREQYWRCTLQIERTVSFLNSNGVTLRPEKRLYLAFAMARSAFKLDPTWVASIGSAVAYDKSLVIRRNTGEFGFVTIEGPLQALGVLMTLKNTLFEIKSLVSTVNENSKVCAPLVSDLKRWHDDVSSYVSALVKSRDIAVSEVEKLLGEIGSHENLFKPFEAFADAPTVERIHKSLMDLLEIVRERLQPFKTQQSRDKNVLRTSLHLSWLSFLLSASGTTVDPVAHEMAHIVHSHLDTIHYLSAGLGFDSSSSGFARDLQAFYQRYQSGEFTFVREYARTNSREFFAVCSEHYFTEPQRLASHAPELFNFLAGIYEYKPTANVKRSTWWVLKAFMGRLSPMTEY